MGRWYAQSVRLFEDLVPPTPVFTLNSREYIHLDLLREAFHASPEAMLGGIRALHEETQEILRRKGLNYASLRSALTPSVKRHEACFIFDTRRIDSGFYAYDVFELVLPLLEPKANQSVLSGDLIAADEEALVRLVQKSLVGDRGLKTRYSHVLYGVYLNNLSEARLVRLHEGLAISPAYAGFLPTTFASPIKTCLSTSLVNDCVKHGKRVILPHEPDRPNKENEDVRGFPFAECGYEVFSLQESYFHLFLSYKIERPVVRGFESDAEMSFNALSSTVVPLQSLSVCLDESKFEYLTNAKAGKLAKAGIASLSSQALAGLIKDKISSNYIYSLQDDKEHGTLRFNLVVELPRDGGYPSRVLVAMEYLPQERVARVITMH